MRNTAFIAAVSVVALSLVSCGSTPAQQQTLAVAGATLAALAAQNNTTVADAVKRGALFCQLGGGAGVIAVATAAGAPASVLNQGADAVKSTCDGLNAIPTAPPPNPGSVTVQVAPPIDPTLTPLPPVTS